MSIIVPRPRPWKFVSPCGSHSLTLIAMRLILISILIGGMSSCETDMSIKVEGENPPTFKLYGSGSLYFLTVSEIPHDGQPATAELDLWKIQPENSVRIWDLPKITYGKVPLEFTQILPEKGSPPPLVEGKTYGVGGPASGANGGSIWFVIREGKAVRVPKTNGTRDR
jgi:hypothetical protein